MRQLARAVLLVAVVASVLPAGCGLIPVQSAPPALPPGTRECFGMAEVLCLNLVAGRQDDQPNRTVTAFRVRCLGTCTLGEGIAEITIVWSDGSDDLFRTEWKAVVETGPPESTGTIGVPI